ncbi:MAG: hypothetical protein FWE70_01985, partial [Oscillospiraceae bacterium]|nr:hypothetical protein [Oscillospiraceae bacterium]
IDVTESNVLLKAGIFGDGMVLALRRGAPNRDGAIALARVILGELDGRDYVMPRPTDAEGTDGGDGWPDGAVFDEYGNVVG